jgi:hypothetical protein
MSSPSHRISSPTNTADSPPKDESDLRATSPTPGATSPPQKISENRNSDAPTSAIDIPQAQTVTKPRPNFPPGWLRGGNAGGNGNGKTGFGVPVGRPKTPRNRRGLSINTERPNPLLDPRPATPSPEKLSSKLSSKMTTPAESPTTPNSRMIFPLEMKQGGDVAGVFGGEMEREEEKGGEEKK